MRELWVDKYRPKKIDEYVFKDANQRRILEKWISAGVLPNILLTGSPGTGKTSVAKMLLSELKIDPFDILEVNASKDNNVDFIRETVTRFAETMGVGDFKYILLDEADYISPNGQAVLRNTIERYSTSVRFILTANYPHKIIDAIKSRCEAGRMHIDKLDKDEFTVKLCTILIQENITFELDAIDNIVKKSYPDLRRGISMIQSNCFNGTLSAPGEDSEVISDYRIDMLALLRAGKYREARTLICTQVRQEEFDDLYRFMYKNLDLWGDTHDKQDRCVLVIRDGLVKDISCGDRELNLSATLIELELISKGQI